MQLKPTVLIVDDEPLNRKVLSKNLLAAGYDVLEAATGAEALAMAEQEPDVILLDIMMPDMDGFEAIVKLKANETTRDIPVVFISAINDSQTKVQGFQLGGVDFVVKPFEPRELLARVNRVLIIRRQEYEIREYANRLEKIVEERTAHVNRARDDLQKNLETLRDTLEKMVAALAATTERRDPYTAGHQRRVAELACAMAREMGLDEERIEGLKVAATLHDFGKIYVPLDILNKPGRLLDIEMALIKIHPQVGYDIIQTIPFGRSIAQAILQHHERLDGTGYPAGLKGEEILLEARIIGVADVVEAMTSHRPYRPGLGVDVALEEIRKNAGKLYDAEAVRACRVMFTERNFNWQC